MSGYKLSAVTKRTFCVKRDCFVPGTRRLSKLRSENSPTSHTSLERVALARVISIISIVIAEKKV